MPRESTLSVPKKLMLSPTSKGVCLVGSGGQIKFALEVQLLRAGAEARIKGVRAIDRVEQVS